MKSVKINIETVSMFIHYVKNNADKKMVESDFSEYDGLCESWEIDGWIGYIRVLPSTMIPYNGKEARYQDVKW